MRTARLRHDSDTAYYHLTNRVAGEEGYHPFGQAEKEMLFATVVETARFYSLDLLSVVVMGSHWHIVCAAPGTVPGREEVIANWRATHRPDQAEPDWANPAVVAKLAARMRDISCFVKDFEQRFTRWFNATRPNKRRGGLWGGRFRSVLLEQGEALWNCLVYVEMNPVRAGLAGLPGDYRFGTWGRMVGGGAHPFADNLVRHLRGYLGEKAEPWSDRRVVAELAASLARTVAAEQGKDSAAIFAAEKEAREGRGSFVLTVRRRVRHWTDGALIGSELFVRDMAARLLGSEQASRKRLAEGRLPDAPDGAPSLFSYRRPVG